MSDSENNEEQVVTLVSPLAKPLASDKLTARIFKLIKKANKEKKLVRGVKLTTKSVRKDQKGIVILAGDVSPIDVISHLPVFCEEKNIRYAFVKSKKDLGTACDSKRPMSAVFIQEPNDESGYKDLYDRCSSRIKKLYQKEFQE